MVVLTTERSFGAAAQECFASPQFELTVLDSGVQLLTRLTQESLHAVLIDLDSQTTGGSRPADYVQQLRRMHGELLIAVASSSVSELRRQAYRLGADEYFVLPMNFSDIRAVVEHAIEKRAGEIESRRAGELKDGVSCFGELIGSSEVMHRVYDAIIRVAESSTSVIIRGESGTGKELVAKSIVALGPRRDKPFISLNCAALPEPLVEAELFGHEKGAYTGAHAARLGHIELAHGGTLFLDEIATLTPHLQTKLLRVLESRSVQRLGGSTLKQIDFRLLTATNENLEQMAKDGRFREDLYYRIHVVPIFLPPLRDRAGDIALLADHLVRKYCAVNGVAVKRLDLEALEVLEEYGWPGNVRELDNIIQRLVLMVEDPVITVNHLPQQILYTSTVKHEALLIPEEGIDFDQEMERIEAAYVQAALRRAGGNKTAASSLLRVNRQKMKYLCRKHKITEI